MSPEMEALKGNKGVVASVIAAAIGFTVFCLVGVAVLLGWIGPGVRPMRAPVNDLGLSPGETLVTADARPAANAAAPTPTPTPAPTPATAPIAAPAPPAVTKPPPVAAPAAPSRPAHEPKRSRKAERATTARATADFAERREPQERRKEAPPPAIESPSPSIAAAAPHPSDPTDHWPQPNCGNCGVVHSITTFPDLWEVRIRFDDGGRRTIRYHKPPRWRVGDRIRYDGGRLERE